MSYPFKQLINGVWVDAANGGQWELINPATEEIIELLPFGDAEDANAAIEAAAMAFPAWSGKTPYERGDILLAAAEWILQRLDDLARITTEESGKPLSESLAEWRSATNYLKWFAEEGKRAYGRIIPARVGTRRIQVSHQAMGVIGTITAWNFPIYNLVRTWAAALAAGCTVVGRPSEYTPRSGMLLAQALHEAGIPAGVINCINGDPAAMGEAMLNDPRVRKMAFTGSTRVGKLLMDGASKTVTRLALELGGNAPILVFPDVNLADVAEKAIAFKFRNAGQVCVAPQRFFVHSQVLEEFSELVSGLARKMKVGNGLEDGIELGPLINARQRDRVESLVSEAVAGGAQLLSGGNRPEHLSKGYFYAPTVISHLSPTMPLYHEEIFGPVLPIIPFSEPEEAIAQANANEYGLAAFVMTNDLNTAIRVSERLEYGMVCINDWLPATPEAPFGGIKQSGMGRETGSEGLLEYMETKTVFIGGVS
jgi:succinate-semialdehyde dehydrogenase / glutarate-semialdehyde dehydrogenase